MRLRLLAVVIKQRENIPDAGPGCLGYGDIVSVVECALQYIPPIFR
jgi:hypothetical protein